MRRLDKLFPKQLKILTEAKVEDSNGSESRPTREVQDERQEKCNFTVIGYWVRKRIEKTYINEKEIGENWKKN